MIENEQEDTGPSTNAYGVSDQELADARSEAKKLIQGDDAPEEAAKPEPTEQPAPEKKEKVEKVAQTEEPDLLSYVPEEHREKIAQALKASQEQIKREQKKYASDIGRVAAYQKQVEDARREAADAKAELAAKNRVPPKKLSEISERFKEVQEVDPELGNSFEELREQIRQEMQSEMDERFQRELSPLQQERQYQHQAQADHARDEFTKTLDDNVSNWREIVYSHDEDGNIQHNEAGVPLFSRQWAEFIQDQPPAFQKAYTNVSNADDALRAIEDHVQWGVRKGFFPAQETERSGTIPNADAIANKRSNDLKRVSVPSGVKIPLQAGRDDTDESPDAIQRLRALARKALKEGDPSIYKNQR